MGNDWNAIITLIPVKRSSRIVTCLQTCAPSEYSDQSMHPRMWSESLLCAILDSPGNPKFLQSDSEDSDQTARMRRLIWTFARRTCPEVQYPMLRRPIYNSMARQSKNFTSTLIISRNSSSPLRTANFLLRTCFGFQLETYWINQFYNLPERFDILIQQHLFWNNSKMIEIRAKNFSAQGWAPSFKYIS